MKHFSIIIAMVLAFAGCSNASKQSSAQASPESSLAATAPDASTAPKSPGGSYRVLFDTSRGPVVIAVDRSLAPNGAKRFYDLVKAKYFDGARFYRVVPGFVVQWGGAADPAVSKKWDVTFPDDPVKTSNTRGTVTFAATSMPNSRTTHMFISLGENGRLDAMGFAPIGHVTTGMSAVDHIYAGYGEKPDQGLIASQGNKYLVKNFPKLDYIKTARIEP